MIKLHNEFLQVEIDEKGAQLHRLASFQQDYLWPGDPQSWNRQAPILFPFVGRLKDDQYTYQGQTYHQTQHGFARDLPFKVVEKNNTTVQLVLQDSEKTRAVYPFAFNLAISYHLVGRTLAVTYEVTNPSSSQDLLYAIGAHPGFHLPLNKDGHFTDLVVTADPAKVYRRIVLKNPGPASDLNHPITIDLTKPLALNHELFKHDAIVLDLQGQPVTICIKEHQASHGIKLHTTNNQYLGIWSPYPAQADLVCIEPWWGIADTTDSDGQLEHKAAMHHSSPQNSDHYSFTIEPF